MSANRDFKKIVRARMEKTGESYTAARAKVLARPRPARTPSRIPLPDFAALAGTSDAVVLDRTGRSWAQWVALLDELGARDMNHSAIAKYVHKELQVPHWWAQTITVGYERIRGRRLVGQRPDGSFSASKSRTFPVAVEVLFRAFADARVRARWLTDVKVVVRKATPSRSIRMNWPDGSSVEGWFASKGASKSSVAIEHARLADRAAVDAAKRSWTERLGSLTKLLEKR